MIPIENSVAGRVADIHHLMPVAGLHIIAEWFLPIRNQLMALKGVRLDEIKSVESHIMALGQCRNYIRKLGVKSVVAADTAGAAREVAARGDPHRGCDRLDACRRNLRPRHPGVEHRRRVALDHPLHRAVARGGAGQTRHRPDHHHVHFPGAQHSGGALQGARRLCDQRRQHDEARKLHAGRHLHRDPVLFRRRRPSRRPRPQTALDELAFFSQPGSLKILGVYPANPFRATVGGK